MILIVNGKRRESAAANLVELWREEAEHRNIESPTGYAMALNRKVVRKDKWQSSTLADGDRVEIIRAMQGG
jgi:sulfur carrier protein